MSLLFLKPMASGGILRRGYIRVEHEAGGAAGNRRINAPCIDATIFLTDARAKFVRAKRDKNRHERKESAGEAR